jgi:hypothetical protein
MPERKNLHRYGSFKIILMIMMSYVVLNICRIKILSNNIKVFKGRMNRNVKKILHYLRRSKVANLYCPLMRKESL